MRHSFNQRFHNIVETEDLVFRYEGGGPSAAIFGLSVGIEKGSFTAVIGRNGSGKSTFARLINALLLPSDGTVVVGGYDTRDESTVWEVRRLAGMVFQNPDNQLVSSVVKDDIAFGPENLGLPRDEIVKRVDSSLKAVDMYEHRNMAPHLLSGGQKQRIAIAGVLAMEPEVVIFDEPTAMLDPKGRKEVIDLASELNEKGITIILITHFMEEALRADRVIILGNGALVMDGPPSEIFSKAEEIRKFGLKLPFVIELGEELRKRGLDIPRGIVDDEELAEAICRFL
ncbi:MAG: energy-coupling factor transporter ATPase [Clostridiales Family XIII bacterium]|nr:energy-coupling factor transporter ATPase [Clostridiales Family XIII bacterium]